MATLSEWGSVHIFVVVDVKAQLVVFVTFFERYMSTITVVWYRNILL